MRNALLTLMALCGVWSSGSAAEPKPESLVVHLASRSFAEREAATKALEVLGTAALPALQKAIAENPDPEVQLRAAGLIERIQKRADMIRLTRGKPVAFDFRNRRLSEAVAELRTKLDIPLLLHPHPSAVKNPSRLITAKSEELPPWEALEKFCAAAGLMERFESSPDLEKLFGKPQKRDLEVTDNMPLVPRGSDAKVLGRPGEAPVILVDGKSTLPADRRTGVRVQAMPMSYPGSGLDRNTGELTLHLDVAPQQGLNWTVTHEIRIGKATTIGGRELRTMWKPDANKSLIPIRSDEIEPGGLTELETPTKSRCPNPRVLSVTFKTDDSDLKSLSQLEGLVLGEILASDQSLVSIDNLAESVGMEVAGPQGSTLSVVSMTTDAKSKAVTLILRINNSIAVWESARRNFGNVDSLLNSDSFSRFVFYDAEGKPIPQTCVYKINKGDGIRVIFEGTIRLAVGDGKAPLKPVKMRLTGTKIVGVAVPFQLKDVPLE